MPEKILVVEDNENNRILLRDVLLYYGHEVIEADKALHSAKEKGRNRVECFRGALQGAA